MTLERAVQALRSAQWDQAIAVCNAILSRNPHDAEALHLLGIALSESGQPLKAIAPLHEAIACDPGNANYQANLALTWRKLGDNERAVELYVRALKLQPDQPQWLYQLGLARIELGQGGRAESALRRALQLQPALAVAAAALARLHESAGDLERAEQAAAHALLLDPKNSSARITQADVLIRRGDSGALPRLLSIAEDASIPTSDRAIAYAKAGQQLDKRGQYQEAWNAFITGNSMLLQKAQTIQQSVYGLQQIPVLARHFAKDMWKNWARQSEPGSPVPVFLVGFPRSGTTLLERMLSMHPRIAHLEEKETLRDSLALLGAANPSEWPLASLDAAVVEDLRNAYWDRVNQYLGRKRLPDEVVIDKLPLNSLHLELIFRLFPQSRILFAVRDPRDVCLSCFMQSFGLNDAMQNFLTIEGTVKYYVQTMSLAQELRTTLPLSQIEVRYEMLVSQPETVLRSVTEFLRLEWKPEVLEFYRRSKRDLIDTPSYQQVAQPLYQTSLKRWRNYASQLDQAFRPLGPLIESLGYERL